MSTAAELMAEGLIGMGEAARLFPGADGRPTSRWSVARWVGAGVTVRGERIRLEGVRVGGRWFTTAAAVARFVDRQTRAATGEPEAARTPAAARKAHLKAEAALSAAGI